MTEKPLYDMYKIVNKCHSVTKMRYMT